MVSDFFDPEDANELLDNDEEVEDAEEEDETADDPDDDILSRRVL
jgi:hypothetical protein